VWKFEKADGGIFSRPAFHNSSLGEFWPAVNTIRCALPNVWKSESLAWRTSKISAVQPSSRSREFCRLKKLLDKILQQGLGLHGSQPRHKRQNGKGAADEQEPRPCRIFLGCFRWLGVAGDDDRLLANNLNVCRGRGGRLGGFGFCHEVFSYWPA
jgi:hypothetical protein